MKWIFIAIGAIITIVSKGLFWEFIGLAIVVLAGLFNGKKPTLKRLKQI